MATVAIEHGLSGPTATKDIDPTGTGLSPQAAAFIAANCSPFTNPRDMPVEPRVPDPHETGNTETMFIWQAMEIPVVTMSNNQGDQFIFSNADPLAPMPLGYALAENQGVEAARMTPNEWAAEFERRGAQDMIYKFRSLAAQSKKYRVVGHGLKAWVGKSTTVSRGHIKAGQYDASTTTNYNAEYLGSAGRANYKQWTLGNEEVQPYLGLQGCSLFTSAITPLRASIDGATEQELGFLAADEGATVRWTDSNGFKFQPTKDRGYIAINKVGWPKTNMVGNLPCEGLETDVTSSWKKIVAPVAGSKRFDPVFNGLTIVQNVTPADSFYAFMSAYKLGTNVSSSNRTNYLSVPSTTASLSIAQNFYNNSLENIYEGQNIQGLFAQYCADEDKQFGKGLYIDVRGVDPTATITVQVCWHIEYIPKSFEPWSGTPSPVDVRFDELAAMAKNKAAFPIVVKGHSFFSSLKSAFIKATSAFGKVFAVAAPIAQTVLSQIPDPRAKALSMGLASFSSFLQPKRQRFEMEEDAAYAE